MTNNVKNNASILAVMGAPGSGKSSWIKQQLKKSKPPRLMIWDTMQEYSEFGQITGKPTELTQIVSAAGKKGRFAVVFHPSMDSKIRARQFDIFCKLALAAGNLTMLNEELKFVTKPGWAPLAWSQVNLTGRHKGLKIIGTSQRPASIDKDFLFNATFIHTGRLLSDDITSVAKAMQIPESELEGLQPLQYVEKNMQTGQKSTGKVTF